MGGATATEMILIRHAPAVTGGRLCGRTDVAADCSDLAALAAVRAAVGEPGKLLVSPALRCRQTARALWPDLGEPEADPALWEQDFGAWEGVAAGELPDLGPMPPEDLARFTPPGGESFSQMCARAAPALSRHAVSDRVTVVAHAGTVRAALSVALGTAAPALSFEVAPLSLTRLRFGKDGAGSIVTVNWRPA